MSFFLSSHRGKSSVINALSSKKVCNAAPTPGETKVWQYITLFKKVYLIDCPGVVYPSGDTEADVVLKSVVRVENLTEPQMYVPHMLARVARRHVEAAYGLKDWRTPDEFLKAYCRKSGRLLKGGEADLVAGAKKLLYDWQRGKLPFYELPPGGDERLAARAAKETAAEADAAAEDDEADHAAEPRVKQDFDNIGVAKGFGEVEPEDARAAALQREDAVATAEEEAAEADEEHVDWDDVFAGVTGENISGVRLPTSTAQLAMAAKESADAAAKESGEAAAEEEEVQATAVTDFADFSDDEADDGEDSLVQDMRAELKKSAGGGEGRAQQKKGVRVRSGGRTKVKFGPAPVKTKARAPVKTEDAPLPSDSVRADRQRKKPRHRDAKSREEQALRRRGAERRSQPAIEMVPEELPSLPGAFKAHRRRAGK